MDVDDVAGRSELARFLRPSAFPGDADRLLAVAREEGATNSTIAELERLRDHPHAMFENVQQVWRALGHGVEQHRN
jgi:hypothetical protein